MAKKSTLAKILPLSILCRGCKCQVSSCKCHASGYRKSLLDVVTAECASAVLEAAEKKRQSLGLKTVGPGPSAVDRSEKELRNSLVRLEQGKPRPIKIKQIVEEAETMIDRDFEIRS